MSLSIEQLYQLYLQCAAVSTDTRKITPNCLFISLKGPNYDANQFAREALSKGARYVLVDDKSYADNDRTYLVDNGLEALQELAKFHRRKLKIPVVGITGSNGKTTTKELIHQVLSTTYKTFATRGNLNNHIGVPLSVLSITSEIQMAVIEMGANHVGEIAALCQISQPSHGLITNIGRAHIEGFGGIEGVIRGKSELYQHLLEHQGVVFINSEDPILSNMAKRFERPILYPANGDYLNIELIGSDPFMTFKGEGGNEIRTQMIGDYNFYNAAAALCIGKFFEVPTELAEQAVANYLPTNNRSQIIEKRSNTIILDAYNANPSSMNAALENLLNMDSQQKAVILGDMLELGDESASAHNDIVARTSAGINHVMLCGPLMGKAQKSNPDAIHFQDRSQLIQFLKEHPMHHTTILIKASRSMGLEEVVDSL
jgi:UDP-N-acetylmuramoyl-tripeptide--D-alanyl-D-alanine ligase